MPKRPDSGQDENEDPAQGDISDINVDEIVRLIGPENTSDEDDELERAMRNEASGSGKRDTSKGLTQRVGENPATAGNPTSGNPGPPRTGQESIDSLIAKIENFVNFIGDLSKGITQVNADLRSRMDELSAEIGRLTTSIKDAAQAIEQARGSISGAPSMPQAGQRPEQVPYPPGQQQPPQQSYQPPPYGYQPSGRPPSQQQPQQGYYQQPQQGYYSQAPPQQGFFQAQQPPPPPPGASPEELVTKGAESLRGTVFDDVVSALNQVASIVFSRLLDAREKILRIDPSFPVQEFEPILSELRANPRMKLSQVDKRKIVDRMLFWASRLPRPP